MTARRALCAAVPGFLLALAACSEASAEWVGDRFFPSTLATTVPTPADFFNPPNFVLLPETAATSSAREIDVPTTYSKLITPDWAVTFAETFRILEQANTPTRQGFDNFVLGTQYQLYTNAEHQFVFTVGGTAALGGSGSSNIANSFSTLTPTVFHRQGLRRSAGFDGVAAAVQFPRQFRRRADDPVHHPLYEDAAHGRDRGHRNGQSEHPALELRAGIQPAHHLVFRWRSEGPPHPPGMGPPGGIRAADAAQRAARRADDRNGQSGRHLGGPISPGRGGGDRSDQCALGPRHRRARTGPSISFRDLSRHHRQADLRQLSARRAMEFEQRLRFARTPV